MPSLTELLFALGAGDRLVGVTRYCTEPAARIAAVPRVGGTKNPDLDAILALAPDLVIMNAEENRREDFARLEDAGLAIYVSDPRTVDAALELITRLGAAVGSPERGRALAAEQRARVAAVAAAGAGARPVRYFCPIWKRPWMGFSAATYAHDVLRLAGGMNVLAARRERYPRVTLAEVAAAAPEIVLLPDEPYPFAARDRADLVPLATTPALASGQVHLVDGKALGWYGPRTAAGVETFAALLGAVRRETTRA